VTKTTHQVSSDPYTLLDDRVLWFDGDSSWTTKALGNKILQGQPWVDCFVMDPDDFSVKRINELEPDINLVAKEEVIIADDALDYNVPEEYKKLSPKHVVYERLLHEFQSNEFSSEEEKVRAERVQMEMELWETSDLLDVLTLLMFIVDTFVEHDIIWGTGRGSSCCSYVLYLIGVHDVDSVHYGLDIKDFFRA